MELWAENWQVQLQLLLQVAIAAVLGGLIGAQREHANRPAGFRTHMLVAAAAALLVGLSDALMARFTFEAYGQMLRADPIRIVEAVVTGVAFLGAGTIFRHGAGEQAVTGLTTAASILLVASVGVAVALGQLVLAGGVTAMTLLILHFSLKKIKDPS